LNLAELNGKPFTLWLTDEDEESAIFLVLHDGTAQRCSLTARRSFHLKFVQNGTKHPACDEQKRGKFCWVPIAFFASTSASCRMEPRQMNLSKLA
jgi:hypothetical protein